MAGGFFCSLKQMEELLEHKEFTRISRNVIVSNKFISKYDNGKLELRKINNYPTVSLPVGEIFENKLREQLNVTIRCEPLNKKEERESTTEEEKDFIPKTRTNLEEFEHNPKLLVVYLHIKKNPDCNVNSINQGCRMPQGTVRRYITILLDRQLIQHNGSKRYGSYTIIQQKSPTEE